MTSPLRATPLAPTGTSVAHTLGRCLEDRVPTITDTNGKPHAHVICGRHNYDSYGDARGDSDTGVLVPASVFISLAVGRSI